MGTTANERRRVTWAALKVLLVYCLAGPLIGLVVLACGLAVAAIADGKAEGYLLIPFILLYGVIFAHLIGIAWAALAAVAALCLWRLTGHTARWIGPASGVVSYAVAAATGHVVVPPPSTDGAAVALEPFTVAYLVIMAAVHIIAASLCWLASRGALERA